MKVYREMSIMDISLYIFKRKNDIINKVRTLVFPLFFGPLN